MDHCFMSTQSFLDLAWCALDSDKLSESDLLKIAQTPDESVFNLLPGDNLIRQTYFKKMKSICAPSAMENPVNVPKTAPFVPSLNFTTPR